MINTESPQTVNATAEIYEMVIEIIGATSDGSKLSVRHLELTESAVNSFCTSEDIKELQRVYQMVKNGNYVRWFHDIEGMAIENGYVKYNGVILDHYSFKDWEAEHAAIVEMYTHCQHIELLGLKPTQRNCLHHWNEYKRLKPNTVNSAYPWVIDDYYSGNRIWRQINKKYYNHYLHNAIVETMNTDGFMVMGGETTTEDGQAVYLAVREWGGKYYAQLMTLREFKTKRKDEVGILRINESSFLGDDEWYHNDDGESVHIACKYENNKYYAQLMTLKQYEAYINSTK